MTDSNRGELFEGAEIPAGEQPRWLDRPKNVRKLFSLLWVVAVLFLLADVFAILGLYSKHPNFALDGVFGFYCVFGFLALVAIVFGAVLLRKGVMRRKEYYGDD